MGASTRSKDPLPNVFSTALGTRLRVARQAANLSLQRVSDEMRTFGVSYGKVSLGEIERGETECSVHLLCCICRAMKVPPQSVLDARWASKVLRRNK